MEEKITVDIGTPVGAKIFEALIKLEEAAPVMGGGLRYDKGKLRYDLVQPWAHEQMVRVLTKGAEKYADRNWEKGMPWSKIIGPLKRHVAAIEKGEDYDFYPDTCADCKAGTCVNHTGELHAAQIACNAHFLTAYYKLFPQGDDRPHDYLKERKIGLDIDEVLCDWVGAWREKWKLDKPTSWFFDRNIKERFDAMKGEELDNFYLDLKPKIDPAKIPFDPACYITSRPVSTEVTIKWLDKHGFPTRPVYTVPVHTTKVEIAKQAGIDTFVDDSFINFVQLNKAGINCYLWDAPHNQKFKVGFKRIKSLNEI